VLAAFAEKQRIPFPLLSDIDSKVIRRYGILNTQIEPDDGFFYGIPFPGVYVTDGDGCVVAKFFHDTYKIRDSAELLIDAALGRVTLADDAPKAQSQSGEIKVSTVLHGGQGTLRQGIRRSIVVRFELGDDLHIYGEPVPDGMVATTVTVAGPPGLTVEQAILPPTRPLTLAGMDVTLQVWSGTVDIVVPIYPTSELASEVRPLDDESATIEIAVRYQACDSDTCLLPQSECFTITVPIDITEVPAIDVHMGHGQREGTYDGNPHFKRLIARKSKKLEDWMKTDG